MLDVTDSLDVLRKGIRLKRGLVLQLVSLELLNSDSYQRPLVKNTVNNVHRNLDENALGIIHVGKRKENGKLFVVDGQNRAAGLKARKEAGLKTPDKVLCIVHQNTTYKDEAGLFLKLNTVRPVSGNAKFWAQLQNENQPEMMIEKIVRREGFSLDFVSRGRPTDDNKNGIRSMAGLKTTWNKLQSQLKPALALLRDVWGHGNAFLVPHEIRTGEVVLGIAKFLHNRGASDIDKLTKYLKARSINIGEIWAESRRASSGYSRPTQFAEILAAHCRGYRKAA